MSLFLFNYINTFNKQMRSLKSFISEDKKFHSFKNHLEINEAVESVEASVVDNKPTDILHLEDSPLPWQKVGRLTPEKFNDIFGGKMIVICIPCTSISTFAGGVFEMDAKKKKYQTGYFKKGKTIIVVSSITKETCEVNDMEFAPLPLYASWNHTHYSSMSYDRKIKTEHVIESIAALRLKIFQERGGSKLWVINKDGKFRDGIFGWKDLFKPFYSIINNYFDTYNKVLDEVEEIVSKGRYIEDVTKLRRGSTWNYAVLNRKKHNSDVVLSIVGYEKATIVSHAYAAWPVILHPSSVSTSKFYMFDAGKGMSGYKITNAMYEKAAKVIDQLQPALDVMNNDFEQLYNKWISKFMLGEPIDFDKIEDEAETNIENQAKSNEDEINKIEGAKTEKEAEEIVSKEVKLTPKERATVEAKMKAWHEGTRKQNIKACSDGKLKINWQVCKELGYDAEVKKIEDEAKSRGLTLESVQIDLEDYVVND